MEFTEIAEGFDRRYNQSRTVTVPIRRLGIPKVGSAVITSSRIRSMERLVQGCRGRRCSLTRYWEDNLLFLQRDNLEIGPDYQRLRTD